MNTDTNNLDRTPFRPGQLAPDEARPEQAKPARETARDVGASSRAIQAAQRGTSSRDAELQAVRESSGIPWHDIGALEAPASVAAEREPAHPRQPWASLPESTKRAAAPDMLAGKRWMHYGREIENPGAAELRRWLPLPAFPAPRSNADKRAAALALLRHDRRMSNREVARLAGVSHTFVAKLRARRTKENPATVATNPRAGESCDLSQRC